MEIILIIQMSQVVNSKLAPQPVNSGSSINQVLAKSLLLA